MSESVTRGELIHHIAENLNKRLNFFGFDQDPSWLWKYITSGETRERCLAVARDLVDTVQNWFDGKDVE